ncbi:MAG: hypothetical protein AMXMBFR53_27970 [Gemmatimonadota bacterium]
MDSVWSATLEEQRPYLVYTPPSYGDTTVAPQRYLTPTHAETDPSGEPSAAFASSGGGPRFLSFVRDELIPRIESRYRTLPYRVFVGHSFGGITTLSALYTMPETFNAYVAIDPSLWWDGRTLLTQAKDYFQTARLEGRTLYVAHANTMGPDTAANVHSQSIAQFNEVMKAYDRSGIRYAFRYYGDDDHGSVPLIAEYDALRFIFDGYRVPLQRVVDRPAVLTEHFRGVSERMGVDFKPSEGTLRLFTQLMMAQDTAKAIEFGEMRAALYPDSWRAMVFLGDVWAAKGDVPKARKYLETALAMSGGRPQVQERLDKLGR